MKYSLDKYKYFIAKTEDGAPYQVIAVSTYAGKVVRGVAKCDPRDEFDLEKGGELAAARCGEKIAAKRFKNASRKYKEACDMRDAAQRKVDKMIAYKLDSANAYQVAKDKLEDIEKGL